MIQSQTYKTTCRLPEIQAFLKSSKDIRKLKLKAIHYIQCNSGNRSIAKAQYLNAIEKYYEWMPGSQKQVEETLYDIYDTVTRAASRNQEAMVAKQIYRINLTKLRDKYEQQEIKAAIVALLNQGGGYLKVEEAIDSHEDEVQVQDYLKNILKKQIMPSTGIVKRCSSKESPCLLFNIYPQDPSEIYFAKTNKITTQRSAFNIYIRDGKTNIPSEPESTELYRMLLYFKQERQASQIIVGKQLDVVGSVKRIQFIRGIRTIQNIKSQDSIFPNNKYRFSYILVFGSETKSIGIVEAEARLNKSNILHTRSQPFAKYLFNSPKVVYFLSTDSRFKPVENALKQNDHKKMFHSLIVVTRNLQVEMKVSSAWQSLQELEKMLEQKYKKVPYSKLSNKYHNFSSYVYYSFESIEQCLFAFCILENEGIRSKFVQQADFDEADHNKDMVRYLKATC